MNPSVWSRRAAAASESELAESPSDCPHFLRVKITFTPISRDRHHPREVALLRKASFRPLASMMSGRCCCMLLAVSTSLAYGWTPLPQLLAGAPFSIQLRARPSILQLLDVPPEGPPAEFGIATGGDVPKKDGIPLYMLRETGAIKRVAEPEESSTDVLVDGVQYEAESLVSILTYDVIEMVQQQGGSAEKVDYLGENVLVEGMLFDDFAAGDTFQIDPPGDDDAVVVTLEIVEPCATSALQLTQLGDDEAKKQSISSLLSLAPGFAGWSARVVTAGRVRAGAKISKNEKAEE